MIEHPEENVISALATFFLLDRLKSNRMSDMDRFCCMIVVIGAIVIISLGCSEYSRLRARPALGTCGAMRSKIDGTSAMKASASIGNGTDDTHASEDPDAAGNDLFMNTTSDGDANPKHPDIEEIKKKVTKGLPSANMSESEEPTFAGKKGTESSIMQALKMCGGSKSSQPVFSEDQVCWGANEEYLAAKKNAMKK